MTDTKKTKILIVEDNKTTAKLYRKYLESQGYEIENAYDGQEGLVKVKEFKPDLILLDIVMPKMDGISMLKELKKDPKTNKLPIIMLTVLKTSETISEAIASGITHYLVKTDYSLEELGQKVKELLKQTYGNE
jgi:DNA-binding response OmpR family regulator